MIHIEKGHLILFNENKEQQQLKIRKCKVYIWGSM